MHLVFCLYSPMLKEKHHFSKEFLYMQWPDVCLIYLMKSYDSVKVHVIRDISELPLLEKECTVDIVIIEMKS